MESNDELLRLNKDFLLLSALIKSHKAKAAQRSTTRSQLRWSKDDPTDQPGQRPPTQEDAGVCHKTSRKYGSMQSGGATSTRQDNRTGSQIRQHANGSSRVAVQSSGECSAHLGSRERIGQMPGATGRSVSQEQLKARSSLYQVPNLVTKKRPRCGEDTFSWKPRKKGRTDLVVGDSLGVAISHVAQVSKVNIGGISKGGRGGDKSHSGKSNPSMKSHKVDNAVSSMSASGSIHVDGIGRKAEENRVGMLRGSELIDVKRSSRTLVRETQPGHSDHKTPLTALRVRATSVDRLNEVAHPLNPAFAVASDGMTIKSHSGNCIQDNSRRENDAVVSGKPTESGISLADPVANRTTSRASIHGQETVMNKGDGSRLDKGALIASKMLPNPQKNDTAKAPHVSRKAVKAVKKTSNSSASDADRDCEIARMEALSAYLTKLRNKSPSKDTKTASPLRSGSERTNIAKKDCQSKAPHLKHSGKEISSRQLTTQPVSCTYRTARRFDAHRVSTVSSRNLSSFRKVPPRNGDAQSGRGISSSVRTKGYAVKRTPSGSPEILSTEKRIKELTEDIKQIEEQLSSGSGLSRGTVSASEILKMKPKHSLGSAGSSRVTLEQRRHPSSCRKTTAPYSWSASGKSEKTARSPRGVKRAVNVATSSLNTLQQCHQVSSSCQETIPTYSDKSEKIAKSPQGLGRGVNVPTVKKKASKYSWSASGNKSFPKSSQVVERLVNVPKVIRKVPSYNSDRSSGSPHKVNPYKKVNTLKKMVLPTDGSKSLHKTRSRYKVRKTQAPTGRGTRAHGQPGGGPPRSVHKKPSREHSTSTRSSHKIQTKKHGKCYSPYKMRQQTGQRGMWDEHERQSFVTRRLHHVVTHSPMLYRSSTFRGSSHRSFNKLDRFWHSPMGLVRRMRWQVPGPGYNIPMVPHFSSPRPHRTPTRAQLVLKRHHPKKGKSQHSKGKQPAARKVMNVVRINGVRYARHGKSLRRLSSHDSSRKITNASIVAKQVLHRSIVFSRRLKLRRNRKQEYCMFFNRFGRCNKGDSCTYKHDPEKVAICTRFLRGTCKLTGGDCLYSHEVTRDKMPVCRFFLKGICTQPNCPYSHVKVNNSASICRDFVRGYCAKGEKCTQKHLLECADYTQTGSCSRKHCPLWHKKQRQYQAGRKGHKQRATVMKEKESVKQHDTSSFIVLADDPQSSPLPSPSTAGTSLDPATPLQIRPVFLKKA